MWGWLRGHDGVVTQPVRPEDMRASDAERELVQQWLRRAHADGSLDLAEFDARVVGAWEARTRGELAVLTADLPVSHASVVVPELPVAKGGGGRVAMKVLAIIWTSVSVLNFALWLVASLLGDGSVYPWFLWVAVPAGAVLGVVWVSTNGGRGWKR